MRNEKLAIEDMLAGTSFEKEFYELWEEARKAPKAQLYTESARKLCAQLEKSSPHDWHLHGRNRNSHGDWKQTQS